MFTAAKASIVSWLGITGGMLTIFSNLQGVLDLAKWAHWLSEIWAYYVIGFWRSVFGFIGIRTDATSSMMICMAAFVTLIAVGARLDNEFWAKDREIWPTSYKRLINWRVAIAIIMYVALNCGIYYAYFIPGLREGFATYPTTMMAVANVVYASAIVVGLRGWPVASAVYVALSMATLNYIFGHASMRYVPEANLSQDLSTALAVSAGILSGFAVLILAPPKAFCRRLTYMLVGVALLAGLSEISALNISVTAPLAS